MDQKKTVKNILSYQKKTPHALKYVKNPAVSLPPTPDIIYQIKS